MKVWIWPIIGTFLSLSALLIILSVVLSSLVLSPGQYSRLYLAHIDATNSKIVDALNKLDDKNDKLKRVAGIPETVSTVGLPDLYDNNKIHQYYYIYLLNYCSGTDGPDGKIIVDFCSKHGQEIWDLFALWQTFDPVTEEEPNHKKLHFQWLSSRPNWLKYGFGLAAILSAMSVMLGIVGQCVFRRGRPLWIMFYASVIAFIMLFVVVAAAQVTFGLMVFHAEEQNAGMTKMGISVYLVNWISVVLSLISMVIWFVYGRMSSKHKKVAKAIGLDVETHSHKYEELEDDALDGSHTPKGHFRGQSMDLLHAHRSGQDTKF
ncbi:hypothetical protein K504DRAFT_533514 [Pleomassaria siparia CBS 279.74]|uniref:Integral membrane protein-like protein n=1 Tax=Pleomassaria siparia CBS 279.74 TaxID=1314801 RepID=A0A6G1KDG7_9PLEO|nr:hypothetical protein K504DRAFT_533514 [Pleomassaria siparia CBS 279.74]